MTEVWRVLFHIRFQPSLLKLDTSNVLWQMFATHTGVMFRDRNHIDVPGFFFPKKIKNKKRALYSWA